MSCAAAAVWWGCRRGGGVAAADGSSASPTMARSRNSFGSCSTSPGSSRLSTCRAPAACLTIQWVSNLRAGLGGTCGPPLSSARKSARPRMSVGACAQSSTCECGSGSAETSARHQAHMWHGQRGHCSAKQSEKSDWSAKGA
eukprot:scaffold18957_cov139-Isochrysis_galbana.AAC.4